MTNTLISLQHQECTCQAPVWIGIVVQAEKGQVGKSVCVYTHADPTIHAEIVCDIDKYI